MSLDEQKVFFPKGEDQTFENYADECHSDKWKLNDEKNIHAEGYSFLLPEIVEALERSNYLDFPFITRKKGLDNKIIAWLNHTFNDVPIWQNAEIFDVSQTTMKNYISEGNQIMSFHSLSVAKGLGIENYFSKGIETFLKEYDYLKYDEMEEQIEKKFPELSENQRSDKLYNWQEYVRLPEMVLESRSFGRSCNSHKRGQENNDFCIHEQYENDYNKWSWNVFNHLASINVKWHISEKNKRLTVTPENDYPPVYILVLDTQPIKTVKRLPSTVIRFGRVPDGQKAIMLRDIPIIPPTKEYFTDVCKKVTEELIKLQGKTRNQKKVVHSCTEVWMGKKG